MIDPDFEYIKIDLAKLPFSDKDQFFKAKFMDEEYLKGFSATLVADSMPSRNLDREKFRMFNGVSNLFPARLSTFILRFPRMILSEINTHRVFSRNSASSRARSVRRTLSDVMNDPFIPIFTRNARGMSGEFVDDYDYEMAKEIWLDQRDKAVCGVLELLLGKGALERGLKPSTNAKNFNSYLDHYYKYYENAYEDVTGMLSIHKQHFNRLLEPFMWHEAVITSSEWLNFINLRADMEDAKLAAAQPEIKAIARLVQACLQCHDPVETWAHTPFVCSTKKPSPDASLEEMLDVFLAGSFEAAQVSYHDKLTEEKSTASAEKGQRLLNERHMSPFEHIAIAPSDTDVLERNGLDKNDLKSNFDDSWVQLRPILEKRNPDPNFKLGNDYYDGPVTY